MLKEKTIFLLLISFLFVTGCSQKVIKPRVLSPLPPAAESSTPEGKYVSQADTCPAEQTVESTTSEEDTTAFKFETAESYYALGVGANQKGEWTKAQEYFEKALDVLSRLDIEEESDSLRAKKFNMLLHEIAEDYKVTLLSVGVLSDETSVSAFLERFENIQNFKKLQEGLVKRGESDSLEAGLSLDIAVYDMPIEWNERVENATIYFQTVARDAFETYLSRSGKYADLMRDILKEKGLPLDLVWLCLIESGFNPKAYSWARALGPWQFIASTGKNYGLKRNWWYDERRDFVKSTYAACNYLSFLYNKFSSWSLALAGYNGGEGTIERAIQKHNTDNFWDLKLRKQTEDYVPLYMAATIIAKDPESYGFNVEYEDPIQFDIVEINQPMDLKKIAKMVETSLEIMKELNPELLRGVTPPNCRGYKLRIPLGTKESFTQNLNENPSKLASGLFVEHKVKKGETLSDISQKYGVPLAVIMETNALTKKHILRIGQGLLIPAQNVSSDRSSPSDTKEGEVTFYTVKEGETLSDIAARFATTSSQIEKLNGLKNPDYLDKGQRLKIPQANTGEGKSFVEHEVKKGETLSYLAEKYGVAVSDIVEANDLSDKNTLKTGQYLLIPTKLTVADAGKKTTDLKIHSEKITLYAAKKGDTVSDLASRFDSSPQEIKKVNSLENLDLIKKGQKLKIPVGDREINSRGTEGKWIVYIVKKGDTLWDIARKFGVLLEKLVIWNQMDVPSRINVGDRIKILQTH
jgi:membrane-bound lytic murein transglycosylase D